LELDSSKLILVKSIPTLSNFNRFGIRETCFVNVRPLFVENAQPPELTQPGERPLHHPAPSALPRCLFGVALRKKRDDVTGTQTSPDCLGVITTVTSYAICTMVWTSALSL
jgi:hypothetical protein